MKLDAQRPLIVAHRGASAFAPENTLAAFRRAMEDGAEGIEFDVRLAKDGVAVVFHDPTLNRTARRDGRISNYTSVELANLDIGSWFNQVDRKRADPAFAAEGVPTLAEALQLLRDFKGPYLHRIKV